MKITVCIASRGRPAALGGVVMALHRMRSTKHELDFVLGLDADDVESAEHISAFEGELAPLYSVAPRAEVRGMIENRMIATATNADAVTLMSDRTFNITPAWDEWIARAVTAMPMRVLWWQSPDDPGCIIPIIPRAYLAANGGLWSPEIFPFWFDDTHHQEIDLMIHGYPSVKARCTYSGARGATANGREFAFWLDLFCKLRPRRREQAAAIAANLGLTMKVDQRAEHHFESYDKNMAERCPVFEERFGDKRDAPATYLAAKTRAEKLLMEISR